MDTSTWVVDHPVLMVSPSFREAGKPDVLAASDVDEYFFHLKRGAVRRAGR